MLWHQIYSKLRLLLIVILGFFYSFFFFLHLFPVPNTAMNQWKAVWKLAGTLFYFSLWQSLDLFENYSTRFPASLLLGHVKHLYLEIFQNEIVRLVWPNMNHAKPLVGFCWLWITSLYECTSTRITRILTAITSLLLENLLRIYPNFHIL